MNKSFRLLVVVAVAGLLMLATAVPAFAVGPPDLPNDPPVPSAAHDISCEGQRGAGENYLDGEGMSPVAGEIFAFLDEQCPES